MYVCVICLFIYLFTPSYELLKLRRSYLVLSGNILIFLLQSSGRACNPALFTAFPMPGQIGRVAAERAFGVKMWGTDSPDGVASRRIVSASAICTMK